MGGRCSKIWVYFSLSYSDLTGNKFNTFWYLGLFCPREKLLCDLPILILTHKPFVTFSLPCPVEASVGAWHPARANPSQAAELGQH